MWAAVSGKTGKDGHPQQSGLSNPPPPRPICLSVALAPPVKPKPVPKELRLPPGKERRASLKDPTVLPAPPGGGAGGVPTTAPVVAVAAGAGAAGGTGAVNGALKADATKEAEARTKSKQEELEKLKQRLACKMEIVNFYGGCCEAFGKMTAAQNKQLQRKLQSCSASDLQKKGDCLDKVVGQFGEEREQQIRNWNKKADDPTGVQRRLARLNEFCAQGSEKAVAAQEGSISSAAGAA